MNKKRLIIALIGLVLFLALVYVMVQSQQSKKSNLTVRTPSKISGFEIIDIGTGRAPRFSPDSKKIAFLSGGWFCLANSDGTGEIQKIAPVKALDYQWMDDSTLIYWSQDSQKRTRALAVVNLKGEVTFSITGEEQTLIEFPPVFLPDGTVGFYRNEKSGSRIFKSIRNGKVAPDSALKQLRAQIAFAGPNVMHGDIWLVSIDGTIKKKITNNKKFAFPQLSPDGKKILASKVPNGDPYLGGGGYVVDLNGNETYIGDPDRKIRVTDSTGVVFYVNENGCDEKWSPDGSKIMYVYARTAPKVEDIDASDIVIKNADGTGRFQIETLDEMEEEPVWSPDGTMIACQTYKTNKIRIFKLK
jgi:Tol biopolymer transport system component